MTDDYKRIAAERAQAATDFDKTVLAVASAALVLSLGFVERLARGPIEGAAWLVLAWSCFALSALLILGSFLTSMVALREIAKLINAKAPPGAYEQILSRWWTRALNYGSFSALALGVAFLIVFAAKNLE